MLLNDIEEVETETEIETKIIFFIESSNNKEK